MANAIQEKPNWTINGTANSRGGEYKKIVIRGEATVEGNLSCEALKLMGKLAMRGHLQTNKARIMGQTTVDGLIHGQTLNLLGELTVTGDCSVERFHAKGAVQVSGLLNAETVDIRLEGPSNVTEIGGQSIRIRPNFHLFSSTHRRLNADIIEGDSIYLESTIASVVRGNQIQIGPNCEIGRVEYRQSMTVVNQSKILEQIKL